MEQSDREKRDKKNAEYLAEIDRRIEDLRQGKGYVHDLIETEENNFDDLKSERKEKYGTNG